MSTPSDEGAKKSSESFDEFRLRVDRMRQERDDLTTAWEAIVDVGRQVSLVRHDLATVRQHNEIRDFRLFGDEIKGIHIPGKFDAMDAQFVELKKLVTTTAAQQTAEIQAQAESIRARQAEQAKERREEQDRHEKWWKTFWGRVGILGGATLALAQAAHEIYNLFPHK